MTDIAAISETWKQYCQSLFIDPHSRNFVSTEDPEPIILRDEVRGAISRLKNGKAIGRDAIPIETIKASGDYGVDIFHALCNKIWPTGTWPQEWTHTVFVPLHKKALLKTAVITV